VTTSESRENTAYGALTTAGPAATLTTGTKALVLLSANIDADSDDPTCYMSFAVSGASAIAAADANSISTNSNNNPALSQWLFLTGLTAGSNTFTAQYRSSTTAGNSNCTYSNRVLAVIPLS
jgi:hypothetical protein